MFGMFKGIFNFVGALILFKIMMVIMVVWMGFTFIFTARVTESEFKNAPVHHQVKYNFVDNIRHNMRIVYGVIVPLPPHLFRNLTEDQLKSLPNPDKALFQWNDMQKRHLIRFAKGIRRSERSAVPLVEEVAKKYHEVKDNMNNNRMPSSTHKIIKVSGQKRVDFIKKGSSNRYQVTSLPEGGSIKLNEDHFIYTPKKDFKGNDSFSYKIISEGTVSHENVFFEVL